MILSIEFIDAESHGWPTRIISMQNQYVLLQQPYQDARTSLGNPFSLFYPSATAALTPTTTSCADSCALYGALVGSGATTVIQYRAPRVYFVASSWLAQVAAATAAAMQWYSMCPLRAHFVAKPNAHSLAASRAYWMLCIYKLYAISLRDGRWASGKNAGRNTKEQPQQQQHKAKPQKDVRGAAMRTAQGTYYIARVVAVGCF